MGDGGEGTHNGTRHVKIKIALSEKHGAKMRNVGIFSRDDIVERHNAAVTMAELGGPPTVQRAEERTAMQRAEESFQARDQVIRNAILGTNLLVKAALLEHNRDALCILGFACTAQEFNNPVATLSTGHLAIPHTSTELCMNMFKRPLVPREEVATFRFSQEDTNRNTLINFKPRKRQTCSQRDPTSRERESFSFSRGEYRIRIAHMMMLSLLAYRENQACPGAPGIYFSGIEPLAIRDRKFNAVTSKDAGERWARNLQRLHDLGIYPILLLTRTNGRPGVRRRAAGDRRLTPAPPRPVVDPLHTSISNCVNNRSNWWMRTSWCACRQRSRGCAVPRVLPKATAPPPVGERGKSSLGHVDKKETLRLWQSQK